MSDTVEICPMCELLMPDVERRRQNTAYVDDEMNYVRVCLECFLEIQEHWKDAWEDYYGGRF